MKIQVAFYIKLFEHVKLLEGSNKKRGISNLANDFAKKNDTLLAKYIHNIETYFVFSRQYMYI